MASATESKATPAAAEGKPSAAEGQLLARLGAQKSKFKAAFKLAQGKLEASEKENTDLKARLTAAEAKADTSASAKRVAELEGQLRSISHKAKFAELARAKGANPDGIEDLWTLSGYKAEKDEVDEAAMTVLIEEQRGKRGYLFGQAANGNPSPANPNSPTNPVKPGPGSGQGGTVQAPYKISDAQQSDVRFVWDNFDRLAEAAQQRIARGET